MAASVPQVFQGINAQRYARLLEKAQAAGMPLQGNQGTAAKFGMEIAWNYRPEAQELTLQCLKAPFFMSSAEVDAKIRSLVENTP